MVSDGPSTGVPYDSLKNTLTCVHCLAMFTIIEQQYKLNFIGYLHGKKERK